MFRCLENKESVSEKLLENSLKLALPLSCPQQGETDERKGADDAKAGKLSVERRM